MLDVLFALESADGAGGEFDLDVLLLIAPLVDLFVEIDQRAFGDAGVKDATAGCVASATQFAGQLGVIVRSAERSPVFGLVRSGLCGHFVEVDQLNGLGRSA